MDEVSRSAFETLLVALQELGVEIIRAKDLPLLQELEASVANARPVSADIGNYEVRWIQKNLNAMYPGKLSDRAVSRYLNALHLTQEDYRRRLKEREAMQRALANLAHHVDALIAPSSPGVAPVWKGDIPGEPLSSLPTGDSVANAATSAIGAPCVTVPLIAINGFPMGVQVIGFKNMDARVASYASWLQKSVSPVIA
ncbi:hypothetical protein P353_16815 [Comamonas testosteroni]|uniref:Amidase domain-containing protein n=1 Tax=Comamonas testosteroni TaxID=285 RepID=A0A096FDR5_COMTE|nr:hypothetical protein P353_16815 [Comamonas testosteroni]